MHVKRTATLAVVGLPVTAWLYAAATSAPRREPIVSIERVSPLEARSERLAAEIARLHERLRPDATPQQPGRNLFSFTGRAAAPPPATPRPALSEAVLQVPIAPPPPFKLIGVAEDAGPDGPVRTAIIAAPGQVLLVKEGDTVATRYRVVKISAEVVELSEPGDVPPLRLSLR
jgi:hypothetical protein